MNQISRSRIALAEKNLKLFKSPKLLAALVTGSVAKGYADDNSDIDTLLVYRKILSKNEFKKIVDDAERSGGGLYYGTPKDGFAVYYYIEGIKCDFAFGHCSLTEKLISEMLQKPETDLIKQLQVAGIIHSNVLYGGVWLRKWIKRAKKYPKELRLMMVKQNLKFLPRWAMEKMAIERGDELFYYESLLESIGAMAGILCGLNKMYHPGKLKGIEYTIGKMKIKPLDFVKRYKRILSLNRLKAVNELYALIEETVHLVDKYMPEVSTEHTKGIQKMILRK